MRSYGLLEEYYTKAREVGVIFMRYDLSRKPEVLNGSDDRLVVKNFDSGLNNEVKINTDLLVLSCAIIPNENEELANLYKLPKSIEGFFLEAHMKLRPVDFSSEGIYLCGLAHFPKLIGESISQAYAASARACTILSKDEITISGIVSQVNPDKCAACLTCVRACPFNAPFINKDGVAEIEVAKCQGCGICASVCPRKAIQLNNYTDDEITAKVEALYA